MIIIDLYYLIEITLPPFMRGINMLAFIFASIKPLNDIQILFYQFFEAKKYELTFNGQVIYLEHILNDQFDPVLRRIYIDSVESLPNIYLFNSIEENEETYLFNNSAGELGLYLYNNLEYQSDNDFTVYVPIGLVYNEILMRYYLDKYKLASKQYNIQEI